MSSLAVKTLEKFSYADYMSWDDGERWELIDGVAYNMSPAPSNTHQRVLIAFFRIIDQFLLDKPCEVLIAPLDVRLPDFDEQKDADVPTVVQPDLLVVCDPDKFDPRDQGVRGAPDMIVEILSPWNAKKDTTTKLELYERHGVREYWIIDPIERTFALYKWFPQLKKYARPETFTATDRVTTSDVLKGLEIDLKEVFPQLPN
ncbi:MAG: Uma2 family endonuclease [Thermoguttaceae bacterium]